MWWGSTHIWSKTLACATGIIYGMRNIFMAKYMKCFSNKSIQAETWSLYGWSSLHFSSIVLCWGLPSQAEFPGVFSFHFIRISYLLEKSVGTIVFCSLYFVTFVIIWSCLPHFLKVSPLWGLFPKSQVLYYYLYTLFPIYVFYG